MATRRRHQPEPWNGDEVQRDGRASGEAERGADRAEGKVPLTVADAAERAAADEAVDPPAPDPDALSPDEKIAEVAEEHRERQAAQGRGHGKL
jgi:hypothetical protein